MVMKNTLWILLLTLLLTPAYSQKIPFSNFTVQNGLPQNMVNAIVQDTIGYLWFATEVGVADTTAMNLSISISLMVFHIILLIVCL